MSSRQGKAGMQCSCHCCTCRLGTAASTMGPVRHHQARTTTRRPNRARTLQRGHGSSGRSWMHAGGCCTHTCPAQQDTLWHSRVHAFIDVDALLGVQLWLGHAEHASLPSVGL